MNKFLELWNEAMDEAMARVNELGECVSCGALNAPLGTLGTTVHYKCRDCGQMWRTENV